MMSAVRKVFVPKEALWRVLTDLDNLAGWAPGIDGAQVTSSETSGVGAVRVVSTAQFGQIEHHVTVWDTEKCFAYVTADSGPFARTLTTFGLRDYEDGVIEVSVSIAFEVKPGGMTSEQATVILSKGLEATLQALELHARTKPK